MTDAPVTAPPELMPMMSSDTLARAVRYDRDQTGMPMLKHFGDLDRYRDAILLARANVIIETGTWKGISATWFATLPQVDRVLTLDLRERPQGLNHRKVTSFQWDSTNPDSADMLSAFIEPADRVLVSLDSGHTTEHVAAELAIYAPLVPVGSFIVVEDTLHHFRPEFAESNPWLGLCRWRAEGGGRDFHRNRTIEGHGITMNPGGWLRRLP